MHHHCRREALSMQGVYQEFPYEATPRKTSQDPQRREAVQVSVSVTWEHLLSCPKILEIFSISPTFSFTVDLNVFILWFRCQECGRAFTQNAHLLAHQRTHTGEKPFKCDECDKAFKESKTLKRHKLIHKNGMPFSCPICFKGIKLSGNGSLIFHTEEHWKCIRKWWLLLEFFKTVDFLKAELNFFQTGFLRQQNLEVHMCVHSEDEPKYKRKLRLRRELIERLRAEEDAEGGLQVDVSNDFSALNHDHMEMVKSRKAEGMEDLSMESQNIIEEEVSGLDHDHLALDAKDETDTATEKVPYNYMSKPSGNKLHIFYFLYLMISQREIIKIRHSLTCV